MHEKFYCSNCDDEYSYNHLSEAGNFCPECETTDIVSTKNRVFSTLSWFESILIGGTVIIVVKVLFSLFA